MDEFELYQTGAFDDNAADSDDDEERARSTFKFDGMPTYSSIFLNVIISIYIV
jgi:hypothetical protein